MTLKEKGLFVRNRLKNATNSEVHALLSNVFPLTYSDATELRNNILIIILFSSYVAAGDLSYYFGMPEASFKALHKQLNSLIKSGFVKTADLGTKDGFSRKLYYLTETGFMTAYALLDGEVARFSYKRRGKAVTVLHDYSIGLNAIQLMLYGKSFAWAKEETFSIDESRFKSLGGLCIDGVAEFKDGSRLFFEEDLGNETIGVLVGKLEKYYQASLLTTPESNNVVFSFRKPFVQCEGINYPAYSPSALLGLIDTILGMDMTLIEYQRQILNKASLDLNDKKILAIIKHLGDIYGVCDSNGRLVINIPTAELERLYDDLVSLKSDERFSELNIAHEEFTRARMRSMLGLMCKKYRLSDAGGYVEPFISAILYGTSIYCFSTNLLCNHLPYIFFNPRLVDYALPSIERILGKIIDYTTLLPFILTKQGIRNGVRLKNAIKTDKGYVCFEYVSRDLGGVLRAKRFMERYYDNEENVSLICMVESEKDALYLSGSDFINSRRMYPKTPRLLYLSTTDTEDKLFYINGEGNVIYA